jgi:Transposase DDE domain
VREYLKALDSGNPVHQGDARYLSPTDPAAAWNTKEGRGKFGYFNNYLVDTDHAVIVDVEATPARLAQEILASKAMLERVKEKHGRMPERLAADKAYGTGPFLGWLSERNITPHIPVLDQQHQNDGLLPREALTFDPTNNHYICPQGKILRHRTARAEFIPIERRRAIASHALFASNVLEARSAHCPCLSMKVSGKMLRPLRTPKPFNTRADYGKKWRGYLRT